MKRRRVLFLIVVAPVLFGVSWLANSRSSHIPPIDIGMTEQEVEQVIGREADGCQRKAGQIEAALWADDYVGVLVHFDLKARVCAVEIFEATLWERICAWFGVRRTG